MNLFNPLVLSFPQHDVLSMISKKYINAQTNGDLYIYKYSRMCQYAQYWNDVTLSCRGLILDVNGNVVAKGFNKFFNMEELSPLNQKEWEIKIKKNQVKSFEKMDGSLGLFFVYKNELFCCTQGSFQSEQCLYAMNHLLNPIQKTKLIEFCIKHDRTVLCEIIYKDNKIVVSYENEKLVLLGSVCNKTGFEYTFEQCDKLNTFFAVPKEIKMDSWKDLKKLNIINCEGFVLNDELNNKVKIKFETYCVLHKSKTSVTTKLIWESLKDFGFINETILKEVPDEGYNELNQISNDYLKSFNQMKEIVLNEYSKLKDIETQKEFAFKVNSLSTPKVVKICLFAIRNQKEFEYHIWENIKPIFKKLF